MVLVRARKRPSFRARDDDPPSPIGDDHGDLNPAPEFITLAMGVVDCCKGFYFTILSVLTIGALLALVIAGFVFAHNFKIFDFDRRLLAYLIIALVVLALVFFLALWVSCRQGTAGRSIVSVVFLILSLGLAVLSIVALIQRNSIAGKLEKLWSDPGKQGSPRWDAAVALEHAFKCCGWNDTDGTYYPPPDLNCSWPDDCSKKIEPDIKKWWKLGAGLLLGLSVILLAGTVFAFFLACRKESDVVAEMPSVGQGLLTSTPPDSAGSLGSNKGNYRYNW